MDLTSILFRLPPVSKAPVVPKIKEIYEIQNSEQKSYTCITTMSQLEDYFRQLWDRDEKICAFDFECSPLDGYRDDKKASLDPHRSDITGISFSHTPNTGIYIPLQHRTGANFEFGLRETLLFLNPLFFRNTSVLKVAHNLSYESMYLYKHGIIPALPFFDTIAAAQLTLKNQNDFRELKDSGLKTLTAEIFDVKQVEYAEVTGGLHFDELHPQDGKTVGYACADSDYALQLHSFFKQWFGYHIPRHYFVCKDVESHTAVYTGMMKYNGLAVDRPLMEAKQRDAEKKISEIKAGIDAFAGRDLNIGANASTNDFKDYLFNELGLPVMKTTEKNQEAADDQTFIMLKEYCAGERPEIVKFLELIQEYRKWTKIKSTYVDGYLKHINETTGRIHADPMPLKTDTGRFAYSKPNLQNMPRKDNDPVGVRKFFVPSPGYVFLDFDFSQIELRVGAFFCRDEKMLDTYAKDGDIHGITTTVIYRIPLEQAVNKNAEHYKERRVIAKNVNFGAFFGLFARGLRRTLKFKAGIDKTEKECEEIILNIKRGYPGLVRWQEETKRKAAVMGYAETALGRRRILKGIKSSDWGIKSFWERCSLNTPIQGTAADILKLALGRILDGLAEPQFIRPVLQVHDELLFEVWEDKVGEAADYIRKCMEETPFEGFDILVKAEGAVGMSFGDLQELEGMK